MNKLNYTPFAEEDNNALAKLLAEMKAQNEAGIKVEEQKGMDPMQMAKMAMAASGGGAAGGAEGMAGAEMGADAMAGASADKSLDFGMGGNSEAVNALSKPELKADSSDIMGMGGSAPKGDMLELGMSKDKMIPDESSLMDSMDRLSDPNSTSSTPDRDQLRSTLMEKLQKKLDGYEPDQLDAMKAEELAKAGPSTMERALLALAQFAGNDKALGHYNKLNTDAKAAVNKKFADQEDRYNRDFNQLRQLEQDQFQRSNRAEDVAWRDSEAKRAQGNFDKGHDLNQDQHKLAIDKFKHDAMMSLKKHELETAKEMASMEAADYQKKINEMLYKDKASAMDPKSRQSEIARNLVGQANPQLKLTGNESAADLLPLTSKLGVAMKADNERLLNEAKNFAKPSDGEKARDVAFGKQVAEYSGDEAGLTQGLKNLDQAIKDLEEGRLVTGTLEGWKAKAGDKAGVVTDLANRQKMLQMETFDQMRSKLKGSMSDKDIDLLLNSAFDPFASPDQNVKSLKNLKSKVEAAQRSMREKAEYFERNRGSLKGYKPSEAPAESSSGSFPRQVKKGNQIATVSNEQELKEAMDEGWK